MTTVKVNTKQVERFTSFFKNAGAARPFTFHIEGDARFPACGHPGALDAFFFITAHQFGFWSSANGCYEAPMVAGIEGVPRKGSDFLFRCMTRALDKDPKAFAPSAVSARSAEDWEAVFSDDTGTVPLPAWDLHMRICREYGTFLASGPSPADMVSAANDDPFPLARFLALAGTVPGYREDPLQKKLQLLAVILENRPEKFLHVTDPEHYRPIIDYHLQRSALRTGLVEVSDPLLVDALERRQEVSAEAEDAVRRATFKAVEQLVERSGAGVAAIDYFFFSNRTRCPEMNEPDCPSCPVEPFCAKRKTLFQPVFRTEAY